MRWVSFLIVLALGVAAILLPKPDGPQPGPDPGVSAPPVALCVVDESSTRSTSIAVASTVAGEGQVTVFAGGTTAGMATFATGTSGSATVPILEVSAVGRAAALVEFPTAASAAASIMTGGGVVAGEVCPQVPGQQVIVGGGSTIEDRQFEVQLMNPYSAEAVVEIVATSESGREANEQLSSITVPPRTSLVIDVSNLLPGREQLVLSIETTRGNVVAVAQSETSGDAAIWRAVAPTESWFVAVPSFAGSREVVIASATPTEVEYQIDVYGPNGLVEAAVEGVISAGGQVVVDASDFSEAPVAFHVVATGPVASFARLSGLTGLALTAGSPSEGAEWLLPGVGVIPASRGRVVLVNVGLDIAEVVVAEVRDQTRSRVVSIDPGQVVEIELDEAVSDGVSLLSDGSIIPMWMMSTDTSVALSSGFPLSNE